MKITVADNAGFCFGVKNALETAVNNSSGGLYTLGEIIHNERVVKELDALGIRAIDTPFCVKEGDKVLIRAHGVTPEAEAELRARGAKIFDATCPFVKKLQSIAQKYSELGYKIIIVGEAKHPEITGVAGYAQGHYQIVSNYDEIDFLTGDKFCVVVQTTFSVEKYENIVKNIQNNAIFGDKTVVFFNTICYTTKARQTEAVRLSRTNDAVLVIGCKTSSNARKLLEIAASNCKKSYLIESVSDLQPVWKYINNVNTMAVLAAASTPQELIEEVLYSMSDTQTTILDEVSVETAPAPEAVEESVAAPAAVKEPEAEAPKAKKELTMDDIMASDKAAGFTTYREGKRVKGVVLSADDKGILVQIGGKKDGFIEKSDATIDGNYNAADYKTGDPIEAIIIKKGGSEYISLSKKEVDLIKKNDEEAEKAFESPEFTLEPPLKIVKNKEGNPVGLEGRLGAFTVFVPGSQIRIGRVKNLEDYLEKKLRLRVLQRNGRRITASQRVILEEEQAAKEESFWTEVVPGAIVKGKVKRFASFGAFVSVDGRDCLAHVSDLSWKKINDPSIVLEIGKTYDFIVLKADRETSKISLGFKQLQKKPYEEAAEKYPVGTVVKGIVARIQPFGAFVQIEDGIDGLIHVSQISHKYIKEASEILHEGDEVEAKIIGFEGNRITLSIKELLPEPVAEPKHESEAPEEGSEEREVKTKAPRARSTKKFEYDPNKSEERRRDRAERRDNSDEPHEWVSDSGVATLADLLKGIDLKFDDDENK